MTIVVGYNRTDEGRAALRLATAEATLRKSKLVVVTSHKGGASATEAEIAVIHEDLDQVRRNLGAAGIAHDVRPMIRGNEPSDDLINVATEVQADFIVIGLRRRSPVGKLLLGSNSQRVLLDAPCPVIAVHASAS